MRVEKLKVRNLRGAIKPVELTFDPNKPIVLIFGENGTGKSTIADAIDFVCNQKFGSLELRKGVRKQSHIVSVNGHSTDLAVEIVYGGQTWRAHLASSKPITTPANAPRAFVLRRADITRVTEEADSDRYKSLADFISVANIEACETSLRKVAAAVEKELKEAIQQKLNSEDTLRDFWLAEGKPESDFMVWARKASQQSVADLETRIKAEQALDTHLIQALTRSQDLDEAVKSRTEARQSVEDAKQKLDAASDVQANAGTLNTLREAQRYLQTNTHANICPVCAKPEPHPSLLAHVEAELERLQTLLNLQTQLENKQRALLKAEGAYDDSLGDWRRSYEKLLAMLSAAPSELTAAVVVAPMDGEISAMRETLRQLGKIQPALQKRIEIAQKQVNQHNALKTHLQTIDELNETTTEKQALAERLRQMHDIVKEERQRHVQQVVDSISATVADLYGRIHPEEPLGNPNFNLNPRYAGSLKLSATFGDNADAPPAAYYSESHLDTLGLCVYLALAKQSGNAIVVLDDVLTSVDGPHLRRVIDLLNEEATQFGHVIITTHQRAWLNVVRLGRGMQADLIELFGWNMANGMQHNRTPLAVESLRTAVSTPHLKRQHIASAAGVLLEQLLDTLTWRYECRLPRKNPPSYTLGELSGAINGKLLKGLRVEQIDGEGTIHEIPLQPLIEACTQDSWIRNQVGAHFNVDEATISDNDVRQFARNTLALADALQCDHCRQLPANNKTGEYWSCGGNCKQLRLYPLQKPG